jgi:hypothetical protein
MESKLTSEKAIAAVRADWTEGKWMVVRPRVLSRWPQTDSSPRLARSLHMVNDITCSVTLFLDLAFPMQPDTSVKLAKGQEGSAGQT